jgi:hypothetical protein
MARIIDIYKTIFYCFKIISDLRKFNIIKYYKNNGADD